MLRENHIISKTCLRLMATAMLLFLASSSFSQSKYVRKYRPLADSLYQLYGVPASVILGVAIIESGSGTSRNAKLLNNHFGIVGKNNVLKTKGIRTRYKQYPSIRDSYYGFAQMLTRKKFYNRLKGNPNHLLWLDAMSKAGYSEVPLQWKTKIAATIRKQKLSSNTRLGYE